MSRRSKAIKRAILPDPVYKDTLIAKFINNMMVDGKKSISEQIFYSAMEIAEKKEPGKKGNEIFRTAIDNVRPTLEVKSRRIGGSNYQVPVEIRATRKEALAIRWIIANSRKRAGHSMAEKLAAEIVAASKNEGASIKKKEDMHKMAEANKAFAHFKW
ncbi:MAG: 30S ribosomal protein S7 [Candidatus Cloacimonadota bacterium]|nr:MAG: 30S ribosomal protein S7 [Candidatus Cloacimonadota bacterium]PIE79116.1 MAG: 30S ribosomal protein S7 [Candidatus Delongbacteria bacterium]